MKNSGAATRATTDVVVAAAAAVVAIDGRGSSSFEASERRLLATNL